MLKFVIYLIKLNLTSIFFNDYSFFKAKICVRHENLFEQLWKQLWAF